MCYKKIQLLLCVVFVLNSVYSQEQHGGVSKQYTYAFFSNNNDTTFFIPIAFAVNGDVAEFGTVEYVLPCQNDKYDTIHCYYSFGRIILEKKDYLRIKNLPDTTHLSMIFKYQTRNKNKSVNTYHFQWTILSNRLFNESPRIYRISYKPNNELFYTTIHSETGHTARPFHQKLRKTIK